MAFRILRDEDKVVSISFNCKKKNRESLMAIINDVIRVYEGEPVVQTEQRHDFIFHNEFNLEQKRNKSYTSLIDCMYSHDLNKHFNR